MFYQSIRSSQSHESNSVIRSSVSHPYEEVTGMTHLIVLQQGLSKNQTLCSSVLFDNIINLSHQL